MSWQHHNHSKTYISLEAIAGMIPAHLPSKRNLAASKLWWVNSNYSLQVELEALKPDGPGSTKEEEFRLSVALLPLRLRIDQNMVTFLQGFFTSANPEHGTEEDEGKATSASSTVQEPEGKNAEFSKP